MDVCEVCIRTSHKDVLPKYSFQVVKNSVGPVHPCILFSDLQMRILNKAGISLLMIFFFAHDVFPVLKSILKTFLLEEVFFSGELMNKSSHGIIELEASLGGYLISQGKDQLCVFHY